MQALQTYDLDRVEVLRGPQGTLYGKNATGGAVSFYSANPSLTNTVGYISAGVGNFHDYSVHAAVGGPVIDDELGVRAAVMYQQRDGWVRSVVPGTSITGFDYGRWYEKSDDGGLPIVLRLDDPNTYFSSVNSFSQEIRLASRDTGAFGWLGGLYYGRESVHATVPRTFGLDLSYRF